jgi:hypothetical protein
LHTKMKSKIILFFNLDYPLEIHAIKSFITIVTNSIIINNNI